MFQCVKEIYVETSLKLDDAAIVRLCADKVMGWQIDADSYGRVYEPDNPYHEGPWNPLTSEADNAQLLDKMVEDGFGFCLNFAFPGPQYFMEFWPRHTRSTAHWDQVHDKDRKRAVVLAALKTKGVEGD